MFIYLITNTRNGKRYVGQTHLPVEKRWRAHCAAARSSSPACRVLCAAIRKYGRDAFTLQSFSLGPEATQAQLDVAEQVTIDALGTLVPDGYNLHTRRGGRGSIHQQTKSRMSAAHRGCRHSRAHVANISAALTGRTHSTDRIEQMRRGRWAGRDWHPSPATKARIGASSRGRQQHPRQIAALRAAHVGAKRSPETCARISAALKASHARRQQENN